MTGDRDDTSDEDLVQALAGAVLLRDRRAEAGDADGTHIALLTVDALNRVVVALGIPSPGGSAAMVHRPGLPTAPGFTTPGTA